MSSSDPLRPSNGFERAIRKVLRPIVRALIKKNIAVTEFYTIVKQTYVDVATDMLGADATDSRISVVTGVHRRDVKSFRNQTENEPEANRQKLSTLSTVVGRWLAQEEYCDPDGRPLVLPRAASDGPSFEGLVQSVSRDIRARTVLDELERQGVVVAGEDGVRLVLDGLVGPADIEQRLHFFAENLGDHIRAAVDNITDDTPHHLERAVYYTALTPMSVQKIENEAKALASDALLKINAAAAELQSQDAPKPNATKRFRFGAFFYKEEQRATRKGQDPDEDQ